VRKAEVNKSNYLRFISDYQQKVEQFTCSLTEDHQQLRKNVIESIQSEMKHMDELKNTY